MGASVFIDPNKRTALPGTSVLANQGAGVSSPVVAPAPVKPVAATPTVAANTLPGLNKPATAAAPAAPAAAPVSAPSTPTLGAATLGGVGATVGKTNVAPVTPAMPVTTATPSFVAPATNTPNPYVSDFKLPGAANDKVDPTTAAADDIKGNKVGETMADKHDTIIQKTRDKEAGTEVASDAETMRDYSRLGTQNRPSSFVGFREFAGLNDDALRAIADKAAAQAETKRNAAMASLDKAYQEVDDSTPLESTASYQSFLSQMRDANDTASAGTIQTGNPYEDALRAAYRPGQKLREDRLERNALRQAELRDEDRKKAKADLQKQQDDAAAAAAERAKKADAKKAADQQKADWSADEEELLRELARMRGNRGGVAGANGDLGSEVDQEDELGTFRSRF